MKTPRILLTLGLVALCAAFSGCASSLIKSASTEIQFSDATGKNFSLTFPKELQASDFHVAVDPASGVIKVDASQIKSSSSGIIESAAASQAQSISVLSNTVAQIVPILAKAAAVTVNPAAAPAVAAIDAPKPVAPEDTPATPEQKPN